jgi:predicted anti-sigma-YlaC factor YlaD
VIKCKEAVSRLWAYLDRNIERIHEAELEEHLGLCRHCCGELEFAKQVRVMLRGPGSATEITPDIRARLGGFLKEVGKQQGRKR